MRLNLGSGPLPMKGWINLDAYDWPQGVDVKHDILTKFPFEDNSMEEVYCGHTLEHIPEKHTQFVLGEIKRVLKPRRFGTVVVPDFRRCCSAYMKGEIPIEHMWYSIILGYDTDPDNTLGWKGADKAIDELAEDKFGPPHRNLFDSDKLYEHISNAGFIGVVEVDIETNPYIKARIPLQVGYKFWKPEAPNGKS